MEKLDNQTNQEQKLVRDFDTASTGSTSRVKILSLFLVVAVLGLLSGFLIVKGTVKETVSSSEITDSSELSKGTAVGTSDLSTFKDTAEGVVREGGIEDEGQYHLERPGGKSQNVYMTSSIVDLSLMVGKKVKVWGQTQTAQYAGWLMDVGRVEVLE